NDGASDRIIAQTLSSMVDPETGELPGWTKLDYADLTSDNGKWTYLEYDLTDWLSNFCIAFHWTPVWYETTKSAQRTYWINGNLTLDVAEIGTTSMTLLQLGGCGVFANDEISNPYNASGSPRIETGNASAQIILNGCPAPPPTNTGLTFGI